MRLKCCRDVVWLTETLRMREGLGKGYHYEGSKVTWPKQLSAFWLVGKIFQGRGRSNYRPNDAERDQIYSVACFWLKPFSNSITEGLKTSFVRESSGTKIREPFTKCEWELHAFFSPSQAVLLCDCRRVSRFDDAKIRTVPETGEERQLHFLK